MRVPFSFLLLFPPFLLAFRFIFRVFTINVLTSKSLPVPTYVSGEMKGTALLRADRNTDEQTTKTVRRMFGSVIKRVTRVRVLVLHTNVGFV
jgi:hypothetical protein